MSVLKTIASCGVNKQVRLFVAPALNCHLDFSSLSGAILNSGLPEVKIPRISLDEYVFENIGNWENHTAIVSMEFNLYLYFFLQEHFMHNVSTLHLFFIILCLLSIMTNRKIVDYCDIKILCDNFLCDEKKYVCEESFENI